MRWISNFAAAIVLVGMTAPLAAHDEVQVTGTITKVQATRLDVKTKAGKIVSMQMDKLTAVKRDKKKVALSDLRVGQSVVVDAYGEDKDLLVIEVRIVSAPQSSFVPVGPQSWNS